MYLYMSKVRSIVQIRILNDDIVHIYSQTLILVAYSLREPGLYNQIQVIYKFNYVRLKLYSFFPKNRFMKAMIDVFV